MDTIRQKVEEFCSSIGQDILMVQGAGGNVSWKEHDEDSLWIKASGTWLADAQEQDIFVPVKLSELSAQLNQGNYSVKPEAKIDTELMPSIETVLHALLPQKVVVHVHAIEALSYLIRRDAEEALENELKDSAFHWAFVDYFKPGKELAQAVARATEQKKERVCNVVFLKNHGIVVGGDSVEQVKSILDQLTFALKKETTDSATNAVLKKAIVPGFDFIKDYGINDCLLDSDVVSKLNDIWSICPDHVVFLGDKPRIFSSVSEVSKLRDCDIEQVIYIEGEGFFARPDVTVAQLQQLKGYLEVIARQDELSKIDVLCEKDISELLNWDSEKERLKMSK